MTSEQMKNWIDNASYEQLLYKWRFEPVGSSWFQGDLGAYYAKVMKEKKAKISIEQQVQTSKNIGW